MFKKFYELITSGKPKIPETVHPVAPVKPVMIVPANPIVTSINTFSRQKSDGPTIAVINNSSVISDADALEATNAVQIQVDRDFAPAWYMGANLVYVHKGQPVPEGAWLMYILDHSDTAGALGYHEMTNTDTPVGKVFAADDQKYNLSWTVTLSHEILEQICDPRINTVVFAQQTNTTGILFALEPNDAVEDDSFAYKINNILVSDFVYPSWFESNRAPNSTKFSHMNNVHAPFQLAKGGYIGYFQVGSGSGWQQETHAEGPGARLLARSIDSRLKKRESGGLPPAK